MSETLDNQNVIAEKDSHGAAHAVAQAYEQLTFNAVVENKDHDDREITSIVLTGMGGSALAALILKVWLKDVLTVPFDIIRGYDLPAYVNKNSLVIASSYSGNTEETLSALRQAEEKQSQLAILASGGKLIDAAVAGNIAYSSLPGGLQPRMAMLYNLKALVAILVNFELVGEDRLTELENIAEWLKNESSQWAPEVPTEHNYAKQIADQYVGKSVVFYGGALTAPLAYKWKISWNETGKNLAFWNEYSEYNHNEFMGWTSHPVEKPFGVVNLISPLEHPQILKRFEISDRLLSGLRPKEQNIELKGDSVIAQLLWGTILADFSSIYLAILNGVDPTPVDLIEKLKKEL